jgi:DNA-binding IclR family transcriptional regulator
MATRNSTAAPVRVLTKVIPVFDLLDNCQSGLPLCSIAEQIKLNKSTAHRFLSRLEREGCLVSDDRGSCLVGQRLVRLGSGSAYQATLSGISRPIIERLWRACGEAVNLGVLHGKEVLYLDVLESPQSFRLVSRVGMRRPLHCTRLGNTLLAWQPAKVRDELLASLRISRLTPRSIVRLPQLIADLNRVTARGYAIDDEEAEVGARCVAAPVFDRSGQVSAGISVSGLVVRMSRIRTTPIVRPVREAAFGISRALGYSGDMPGRRGSVSVPSSRRRRPESLR